MQLRSVYAMTGAIISGLTISTAALAQQGAPITVTPDTLAPEQTDSGFRVDIPQSGALQPPEGAENLSVEVGDVLVEGGFTEVDAATKNIALGLKGRRVSLKEVYEVASAIEALHAKAGYVLARVSVPPQELRDGGILRIVVTDGFVEAVDVTSLPERIRKNVEARVKGLKGKHHVTLAEIEQPLLIASEVPGLTLSSTLMRGTQPGGARIVLDGKQKLVTGSVGVDNSLDRSLDRWAVTAQLALNSALGGGEQIYGFVSSDYDLTHLFDNESKVRVLGGGAVVPFWDGRLTFNPEITFSRTAPKPQVTAPASVGKLRRIALRAAYSLNKTRAQTLTLTGAIEQLSATNDVPSFAVRISNDRYIAARLGLSWTNLSSSGARFGLAAQVSQGLGDIGAISKSEALASGTPYSRVGADNNFTRLSAQANGGWALGGGLDLSLSAKAQTSFSKPVLRSEQFVLEGRDTVSAYTGGETAVDEGIAARFELARPIDAGKSGVAITPYLFASGGLGSIKQPTVLESGSIRVAGFGAGGRLSSTDGKWSLLFEYAHGISNVAALDNSDRVNFGLVFRF
jgi:hemolysin activation/secretion protein